MYMSIAERVYLVLHGRWAGHLEPPLVPIPVAGPFDCVGVDVIQVPFNLRR